LAGALAFAGASAEASVAVAQTPDERIGIWTLSSIDPAADMAVADVADRARLVTVRVECVQ